MNAVDLRTAMSHFPSGVTVVTTHDERDAPVGTTASAVTSLSLDPPLVLVCLAHTSKTFEALLARGRFAVNLLAGDQAQLAHAFARPGAGAAWDELSVAVGRTGSPLLGDALAALDCDLEAVHPGGDHGIVVGRVVHTVMAGEPARPALLHFRRALQTVEG